MAKNDGKTVKDVMTVDVRTLPAESTVDEAARAMRDASIGDVIVVDGDKMCGIVTDRDVVVRVMAEDKDPHATTLREICSQHMVSLEPGASVDEAVRLMAEHSIRRIPIVRDGAPVGIVSIGDLAQARDPRSALGAISAAPPNA